MKKSIYRMKPSAYIQMDFSDHTKKKTSKYYCYIKKIHTKKKIFFFLHFHKKENLIFFFIFFSYFAMIVRPTRASSYF